MDRRSILALIIGSLCSRILPIKSDTLETGHIFSDKIRAGSILPNYIDASKIRMPDEWYTDPKNFGTIKVSNVLKLYAPDPNSSYWNESSKIPAGSILAGEITNGSES